MSSEEGMPFILFFFVYFFFDHRCIKGNKYNKKLTSKFTKFKNETKKEKNNKFFVHVGA